MCIIILQGDLLCTYLTADGTGVDNAGGWITFLKGFFAFLVAGILALPVPVILYHRFRSINQGSFA